MKSCPTDRFSFLRSIFVFLTFVYLVICLVIIVIGLYWRPQPADLAAAGVNLQDKCYYDLDVDGRVNRSDLQGLLQQWNGQEDIGSALGILSKWGEDCAEL